MSGAERRNHERKTIQYAGIPGKFYIDVDGASHEFSTVHDVSISGLGITFQQKLERGKEIELRYVSDDMTIHLKGSIVWCEEGKDDHRLGIRFDSSDMNSNVLFFMTLREYIDDFGEAF